MTLGSDLRFTLRYLRRRPGFVLVAGLTLALAVGATTAVFSLVWGVVLQPLALPGPDRLYWVGEDRTARGGEPAEVTGITTFRDWREASSKMALGASFNVTDERRPLLIDGAAEAAITGTVSAGYFSVLGVTPALGREFLREEEADAADGAVVLAHGLWQERFGGDPAVLGREVIVGGVPRTVVGVLPEGFRDPLVAEGQLWIPLSLPDEEDDRGSQYIRVVGRLAEGAGPDAAAAELTAVTRRLGERHPEAYDRVGVTLQPLRDNLVGDVSEPSKALFGAVLLVLAIACVNLANLLLARTAERERELAVRTAVGAGRARLVRQLLTESIVLSLLGGLLALPVGWALLRLLVWLAPAETPRLAEVGLDVPVFAFALMATLVVGVLFGILPAWRASRRPLAGTLREGGRTMAGGSRLRRGLIVGEVALSLALLVGAGLLVRSLLALGEVESGFDTERLVAAEVSLDTSRYPESADVRQGLARLLERLEAQPGVEAVGATSALPLTDYYSNIGFGVEGEPPPPEGDDAVLYQIVTPGYFETLGLPLIEGRTFGAGDHADAPPALIVTDAFVRDFMGEDAPAIGRRVTLSSVETPWTVVGVVPALRYSGLGEDPDPLIYLAHEQFSTRDVHLVLRASGEPSAVAGSLQEVLRAVDPQLAILRLRTGDEIRRGQLAMPRFLALLVGSFAAVAMVLAAVGLYGVLAFLVAARRREIGIRLALGARPREVVRLVLTQGLGLALGGLALGVVLALALSRGLGSLLFQVQPDDLTTLFASGGVLLAAAAIACLAPALRAAHVDPVQTLRQEN